MTTDRPYRPALSLEEAVAELKEQSGKQFNPLVVDVLTRILKRSLASAEPADTVPA
jgi:HD-GYP domain-containing protein (c-di-GMP phosphodiesterase class II)